MDEIATLNDETGAPPAQIPATPDAGALACWLDAAAGVLPHVRQHLAQRGAHAARTVVLVPYAQLMPLARALWGQLQPDGFAPRFETTLNWSTALGGAPADVGDVARDMGRDLLTAQALLEQAGLAEQRDALAGRLVEAAHQLAPAAAAHPPEARAAWASGLRASLVAGLQAPVLALESAVALIALEWAAASRYPTDILFAPSTAEALDCLVVLEGFQPDPLAQSLAQRLGDRALTCSLVSAPSGQTAPTPAPATHPVIHPALSAEDEAHRAAACVLAHLVAGRQPVALVANDRLLTRRIRAALAARGVRVRDETGWKLSTTRVAAGVMAALRACAWDASADDVLDWLKNAPAMPAARVSALERALRRHGRTDWRAWCAQQAEAAPAQPWVDLMAQVEALRTGLGGRQALATWLEALRGLLQAAGQWALLCSDPAGERLRQVLRLDAGAADELGALPLATRRVGLAEFTAWVHQVLEAASFVPAHPPREQVVILPLSQLLARPFGAVVVPGCDELRLPASPEPTGLWTPAQRETLGLVSRQQATAAMAAAWRDALARPQVDVLWRCQDDGGEPLQPSPLLVQWQRAHHPAQADDPRPLREVACHPTPRPEPDGAALPVQRLSASAYADLRKCPYRFFALRQLGLQEQEELDDDVDQRDFGLWLHAVLGRFHVALAAGGTPPDLALRRQWIDRAAAEERARQHLADDAFLPYAAAWPRVREGYLQWLAAHEAGGYRFDATETWHETPLGALTLIGRIDRIDRDANHHALVIDYKTESPRTTREAVANPLEDTQLAFYAALLPDDTLRAAYVNLSEAEGTRTYAQNDVVAARDALLEGIQDDLARIAGGAPLPALGEGRVCDFCAARGLCRRDFWEN